MLHLSTTAARCCAPLLQRGIDLPSLDPSYFTSLSYYILLLFGLRGVLTLLFRCARAPAAEAAAQAARAWACVCGGREPRGWRQRWRDLQARAPPTLP